MKRLILLPLAVATAFATGDYYEETVPPLPTFLGYDRLPKKSLVDIAREKQPVPKTEVDFDKALLAILAQVKKGKAPHELLGKVDGLIAAERARAKREGPTLNALLHDVRDLCAGPAEAEAAAKYLEWRFEHAGGLGYLVGEEGKAADQAADESELDELWATHAKYAGKAAPPELQPHYYYAGGAYLFIHGKDKESKEVFDKIVQDFPDHPRAEAASYMAARCLCRMSRVTVDGDEGTYKNDEPLVKAAREALEGYLKKYPTGRFVGDVYGWMGGQELNAGKPGAALVDFIHEFDRPGHPEYFASGMIEIEKCLRALHDQPGEIASALVNPQIAQAVVYFAGNEIEPIDGDGKYETPEYVATWRKALFAEIASALAKKPELFRVPGWEPRYVASLALAASGAGEQDQALKILEGVNVAGSDDLAFARGVVLQRARRSGEAAEAFGELFKKLPKSPLAAAAQVRQALCLVDAHRSGEAALALMALDVPKKKPGAEQPKGDLPKDSEEATDDEEGEGEDETYPARRDTAGVGPASPAQIRQLLDTIYNFAPLPELAAVLKEPKIPGVARLRLREVLAVRHLARERFTEARAYLTDAQWARTAGPLAELTAAAQTAKTPADKAATAQKLAEAWAAARGKLLTVPLDTEEWRMAVYKTDHGLADFRRVENGAALGLTGAVALDLENRDELRHAFNWWILASDAEPKTPRAATAIWRALRAMPDIAEVSPFALDRATTKKWDAVAKKLYERLQTEHPTAPETKRFAVWWDFGTGRTEKGEPERREEYSAELAPVEAGNEETPADDVNAHVKSLWPGTHPDVAALKTAAASEYAWAKTHLTALPSQCAVNYFEDLDQFLATPGISMAAANRYVELRYDTLVSASVGYGIFQERERGADKPGTVRGDDALLAEIRAEMAGQRFQGAHDFLAFLEIAVTANHWVALEIGTGKELPDKDGEKPAYWGRDYVALEKMCRAWLDKYPTSPKREAVLLLHCRALRHAMEPFIYERRVSWPEAQRWEGAVIPEGTQRMKFDAKGWKAALDRYDKEFPKGRYAADVLSCRADLAVRLKDWKRALQISIDQKKLGHLGPDATNRLNEIFARLAVDEERADLLAAIRATDGARGALLETLKALEDVPDHPLDRLNSWLTEQAQQ